MREDGHVRFATGVFLALMLGNAQAVASSR